MRRLTIAGSGIYGPNQITLETDRELSTTKAICHVVGNCHEMIDYFSTKMAPKFDVGKVYQDFKLDLDVYNEIAAQVIDIVNIYDDVVFVVHGHPLVYVAPTQLLANRCKAEGIDLVVLPGVSSIDTMVLQVGLEIGRRGLQVFDSNRFVYYKISPDPRIPMFLFQPGCFGSAIITKTQTNERHRFDLLRDALLQCYNSEHVIYILQSAVSQALPASKTPLSISQIPDFSEALDYTVTIYVPAQDKIEISDAAFYETLRSPEVARHLITN